MSDNDGKKIAKEIGEATSPENSRKFINKLSCGQILFRNVKTLRTAQIWNIRDSFSSIQV